MRTEHSIIANNAFPEHNDEKKRFPFAQVRSDCSQIRV